MTRRNPHFVRGSCVGALALPLLVWYLGSFYFHGDLGKWLDDYGAHVRDPETGSFEWSNLLRYQWWFFWRPIHVHLVFTLQTLCWNHDWINHLFSALMHALACFNLLRFLRVCGVTWSASAIAGLLMLGAAQGFEVIFWPATVSTSIATAAFFWAARIAVRHAQHRNKPRAVLVLGLLGFAIPCMYEQPAAALAALPILYLGASTRSQAGTVVGMVRRVFMALTPAGLAVLLYLTLFVVSVRRDGMTRESQFARTDLLWDRTKYMFQTLGVFLDPISDMGEFWNKGIATLRESSLGLTGWSVLGAMGIGVWVACHWSTADERERSVESEGSQHTTPRVPGLALMVFALASIAFAIVPILAIQGAGLSVRLTYFPLACAFVVLAAVLDAIIVRAGTRKASLVLAAAAAVVALGGAVMLVGAQAFVRMRHEADLTAMRHLRNAVPNPAAGSIFVPMVARLDPRMPTADRLRNSFLPMWSSSWAIGSYIKTLYGRADVHGASIYQHNQSHGIVRLGEPTMIAWNHYIWHLPTPRVENYCPRFTLEQMIPYTIGVDGSITLVDRIRTRHPDGVDRVFEFPTVVRAAQAGVPTREVVRAIPVEEGREWLVDWTWPGDNNRTVRFLREEAWGAADRAVMMHPPWNSKEKPTDAMDLPLVPSAHGRRIVFYATFAEQTIDLSAKGDGVEFVFSRISEDDKSVVLLRQRLDPKDTISRKAWTPIALDLEPSTSPARLRISVLPGPSGDSSFDRVIITCGEAAPLPPAAKRE